MTWIKEYNNIFHFITDTIKSTSRNWKSEYYKCQFLSLSSYSRSFFSNAWKNVVFYSHTGILTPCVQLLNISVRLYPIPSLHPNQLIFVSPSHIQLRLFTTWFTLSTICRPHQILFSFVTCPCCDLTTLRLCLTTHLLYQCTSIDNSSWNDAYWAQDTTPVWLWSHRRVLE